MRKGSGMPAKGRLVFIDFEASSLSRHSWPIELGWAVVESGRVVIANSRLIKPAPTWDVADWSPVSEDLHGITLAVLERDGQCAHAVWQEFQRDLTGVDALFCDAPAYDGFWCRRLGGAAGTPDQGLYIRHFANLFSDMNRALTEWARAKRQHTAHRAGPDALQLARFWLEHSTQTGQPLF